jgi:hypothetical protein
MSVADAIPVRPLAVLIPPAATSAPQHEANPNAFFSRYALITADGRSRYGIRRDGHRRPVCLSGTPRTNTSNQSSVSSSWIRFDASEVHAANSP